MAADLKRLCGDDTVEIISDKPFRSLFVPPTKRRRKGNLYEEKENNAPVYNGTEEQLEESEKYGLAVISIGGLQDKYYRFNLQQGVDETYEKHAEILDGTDGWNRMLRACGIEGYELTPEQVRENRDYSTELIPALTGYEYENTTIDHRTNSRTYVSTITNTDGIVTLCQVLTENHGHMPSGYDAEYAWNFMKHFSRDLETGMLVYTE